MRPTNEQRAILDAFKTGETVAVEAMAGTGKTTTLKMLARDAPRRSMAYLAFNKAIADEAAQSFPANVECRTVHSLAMRAVGGPYRKSGKLNMSRIPSRDLSTFLNIPNRESFGGAILEHFQLGSLVNQTLSRFTTSADPEITSRHVPRVPSVPDTARQELTDFIVPRAHKAWTDVTDPKCFNVRFFHGVYLKLWQLGKPEIAGSVVLADEYQDTDPVIQSIVDYNVVRGSQLVAVGDSNQQIYEWRGAIDALSKVDTPHRLPLRQSFRFGEAVADRANETLALIGDDYVVGAPHLESKVTHVLDPDAILTRTNAGTVRAAIDQSTYGRRVAIVGGTRAISDLSRAARDIQRGRPTTHPDLIGFTDWESVREHADTPEGTELRPLVTLVDRYGPDTLDRVAESTVTEDRADVVVSTAHKAKGRQWERVAIGSDYTPLDPEGDIDAGEARLQYVAITRAQSALDASSLDIA